MILIWNLEKMILMNLFTGKEWRLDVENGAVDTEPEGREWDKWKK